MRCPHRPRRSGKAPRDKEIVGAGSNPDDVALANVSCRRSPVDPFCCARRLSVTSCAGRSSKKWTEGLVRIAQVAPLYESVPPSLYGGTERVVSNITEALVRLGHDVTLFASGDSRTSATLIPLSERALRLDTSCRDPLARHIIMLDEVFRRAEEFDVIHFHVDYLHFPLSQRFAVADLTTLHGRLDLPELTGIYRQFAERPLVSISNSQRRPLPWANWRATIYHGVDTGQFCLQPASGSYLAFLGRISPEKRVDRAIDIAKQTGIPLRIAAKVDRVDAEYFRSEIEPLLDHPLVEYIGEIGDADKNRFLGGALALLFPVDWPEPFGLAMIEAMACGTPVIAFRCGSIPEVVDPGTTGWIVDNIAEAVAAVRQIESFDRAQCRRTFEQRFSSIRMAKDYLAQYKQRFEETFPGATRTVA
jgi:glycosyltransferase involved in cell wall biosynthesis